MTGHKYEFRLYTCSEDGELSGLVSELHELIANHLNQKYGLSIKNIFEAGNAESAARDGVFTVPTLLRKSPMPVEKIIGDLRDARAVTLLLDQKSDEQA